MESLKKIISFFLFLLLITSYSYTFADDLSITGESAILIDGDTGQILYEKDPHKLLYPASTTKIMTGILAIELGNPEDVITIDEEVVDRTDGSHIALEPGEQLTLHDLLRALLIQSANDSAVAIAKYISGSVESFVDLMNKKAKEVGALNTHFNNPNGLPDESHQTTAYDLAMMAKYAMKNDTFRSIVKNYTYTIPKTNKKDEPRHLQSNNRLLYSNEKIDVSGKLVPIKYDGIIGIKTGFTNAAQQCLVASAVRNGRYLISVVLKSAGKNIYSDTHKLLDYGFDNFNEINLSFKNEFIKNIEIDDGSLDLVAGVTDKNLSTLVPKGSSDKIEKKINISKTIEAPIKKGAVLGNIEYFLGGKSIGKVNVVSTVNVEKIPTTKIFTTFIFHNLWILILVLFSILLLRKIIKYNKRKRRKRRRNNYL